MDKTSKKGVSLGIELGSTRIKAVVIDGSGAVLASGSFVWENRPLADNVWTYDLADARAGLSAAYAACANDYAARHGAQLCQSILDGEEHVGCIAFQTTLAGYIHFLLTGRKVLGFNDASGMFPLGAGTKTYDAHLVALFKENTGLDITAFFPEVLSAGADAGALTEDGARLLDPSGALEPGIPLCPPEGDGAAAVASAKAIYGAGYGGGRRR